MNRCLPAVRFLAVAFIVFLCPRVLAQPAQQSLETADVTELIGKLQQLVETANGAAYLELLTPNADRESAAGFIQASIPPRPGRAVVTELERRPLARVSVTEGLRLMVQVFYEDANRARLATWGLDLLKLSSGEGAGLWRITSQEPLTAFDGLFKLSLNPAKQYRVRGAVIVAEDLELKLAEGSAFVAETDEGISGLVFLGRGEMNFHPTPQVEREQVKIYCGTEALTTPFSSLFVRVNPDELDMHVDMENFVERPVDSAELKRANEVFAEFIDKSYHVDLTELSPDLWSLDPGYGDFLADVKTRRFETLTFARSASEPEDVNLFDRKHKRNIALYASKEKESSRGRFYAEDSLVAYDVLDYEIDTTINPERYAIDGRTLLRLQIKSFALATLTIKLADPLTVRSVTSDRFGRLLYLRAVEQDSILVSLPTALNRGSYLTIAIEYSGILAPQDLEREALDLDQQGRQPPPAFAGQDMSIPMEPKFLYSSRSYWYAQSTTTDYATAVMRITVPGEYSCVASGDPVSVKTIPGQGNQFSRLFTFDASQPLRYLAVVFSRFVPAQTSQWILESDEETTGGTSAGGTNHGADDPTPSRRPGVYYDRIVVSIAANPRQVGRGQDILDRSVAISKFYASLIGDIPYPSLTIAIVENTIPGGHSPGYVAVLNQPLPATPFGWRNDPVSFDTFPQFFLAHEIAHQWWGQAVGWNNYHEQWLSEGFAQYFAVLYAREMRGDDGMNTLMRQIRRSAMSYSPQGPVYLGYRLGHIKNDSKVFRALVYNKGAAVLHMLRRLIGDEAFFDGLRKYYAQARFKKVGTEDVRQAFELAANRSLERFFERWIYDSSLPRLTFSYTVGPRPIGTSGEESGQQNQAEQEVTLRFEQTTANLFDVPVTVTLNLASGPVDVMVPVTDKVSEMRVPLKSALRGIDLNRDNAALADFVRR